MTKKMTKKIIISDLFKNFHKATFEDGTFEYIKPSKLEVLKANKDIQIVQIKEVTPVVSAPKADGELSQSEELMKLKKDDLAELAKRNGFTDEITNEVTKAILVEFIISNK